MEYIDYKQIVITEHATIPEQHLESLQSVKFDGITDYMQIPKYLGIGYYKNHLSASYFIGTCWLTPSLSIAVLPKIANIDFIKMFLTALETESEADYFAKCYRIDFDKPAIKTPNNLNILSPLLVLHYLTLLEKLVKRGLKRGYIVKEENLKSKIKGKIIWANHLQQNVFQKREDRIFCRYQEYTIDIPENRLLKKALLFCEKMLDNYASIKKQDNYTEIKRRFNKLKQHFVNINDDIEVSQIQKISANKLFINYKSAVKVAKMILRRFDYSLQNTSKTEDSAPPFSIDMARLFELYVLNLLGGKSDNICFQFSGYSGDTDFLKIDEQIIIDSKYKLDYGYDSNDIRQLSGYARDTQIIKKLKVVDDREIKCLIIYPNKMGFTTLPNFLIQSSKPIHQFRNFYKISVKLPTTKNAD